MKYSNETEISIRQMQCFLAVAEQSSFSRAAVQLNMGQSTLSKCVSLLERTLGLRLFRRELRPISLTPAGEVLYQKWSQLVEDYGRSLDAAFERANESSQRLTVGLVDSINTLHFMPMLRKKMLDAHPGLELRFEYTTFSNWRSKLKAGEVDMVLTVLFDQDALESDYVSAQVSTCAKSVCMLPSNPLAMRESICFEDLRQQRFLIISPEESPAYYDYVRDLCQAHGFEPQVARFVGNTHGLFSALQRDDEVIICDRYFRDYDNPIITKFPLPEVQSGLVGIWKRSNPNRYIDSFISNLRETEGI